MTPVLISQKKNLVIKKPSVITDVQDCVMLYFAFENQSDDYAKCHIHIFSYIINKNMSVAICILHAMGLNSTDH